MPDDTQRYEDAGLGAIFDFGFKRFITLSVIKVLFGLGLLLIAIGWLMMVIAGFMNGALAGFGALVIASIVAILQVIFFRVWLELIVVIFRIGENTSILVVQRGGTPSHATPTEPGASSDARSYEH